MASAFRTVRWQPTAPVGYISGPALTWPDKHRSETLDYSLDVSAFLSDAAYDTISTAVMTATPGGLTIAPATNTRGIVTSILSGGTSGQVYTVKVSVTTAGGLVAEFDVGIIVT